MRAPSCRAHGLRKIRRPRTRAPHSRGTVRGKQSGNRLPAVLSPESEDSGGRMALHALQQATLLPQYKT